MKDTPPSLLLFFLVSFGLDAFSLSVLIVRVCMSGDNNLTSSMCLLFQCAKLAPLVLKYWLTRKMYFLSYLYPV